jgi:hypothetical protein
LSAEGRTRWAILCLVAAAVATGCGDGDSPRTEKEQIADAIRDFNRAFSKGDGEATCKLITDQYRNSIEVGQGKPCPQAVEQQAAPEAPEHEQVRALSEAEVSNIQIVGAVATGDLVGPGLDSGPPAQAERQGGRWLVSATAWGSL